MEFSPALAWWVLAGTAVAAELATGTFYLLMIAFGTTAGALAAHAALPVPAQFIAAALVGGGATALLHRRRGRRAALALPPQMNRDVNLDIGERVEVGTWAHDQTARVRYRGSTWSARLAPGAIPATGGDYVVAAVDGNWLVLAPATGLR